MPLLNELGKWALENKKYKAAERVFLRSIKVYPIKSYKFLLSNYHMTRLKYYVFLGGYYVC